MHNLTIAVSLSLLASVSILHSSAQSDESKRVSDATTVMAEMMAAGDKGIPRSIMDKAEGVAVFPGLIKAGLGIGGQRGHGILSARDTKSGTWSSPAFLTITGGSIGAQIGVQSIDLILVVNDQRGLQQLVQNQFKVGADASVAAGPVGRDASAATDIQMRAQILSYSRTRGLFAGITLEGATFSQDRDANERFYGAAYRTSQIVFDRLGGAPNPVADWRSTLGKYAK
jgi:lipid-binding SYLF domain-containing protein